MQTRIVKYGQNKENESCDGRESGSNRVEKMWLAAREDRPQMGLCVTNFFYPIESTFSWPIFFSRGISLPILPHISKKRKGIRPKCKNKKKRENTKVLNKRKRTICVFKCWLNCQLASFEALLALEKTIEDPTPSWCAVPFCVLSHKNDIRQK